MSNLIPYWDRENEIMIEVFEDSQYEDEYSLEEDYDE